MDALFLLVCLFGGFVVSYGQASTTSGIALGGACTPPTTVAPTKAPTAAPASNGRGGGGAADNTRRRRDSSESTCILHAHCDPSTSKCACVSGYKAANNNTTCETQSGAPSMTCSVSLMTVLMFWVMSLMSSE